MPDNLHDQGIAVRQLNVPNCGISPIGKMSPTGRTSPPTGGNKAGPAFFWYICYRAWILNLSPIISPKH